jgi:rhamnose transport system substrate-binding protein
MGRDSKQPAHGHRICRWLTGGNRTGLAIVALAQTMVIIAPTTVGIAASARAVTDAGLIGKVAVTGLGTPNQMREYVKNGAAPEFALWNPGDLGYLSVYVLEALATGKIKGEPGEKFTAGKLGEYTIQEDADLGVNILLGLPFIWDKTNIDDSNW